MADSNKNGENYEDKNKWVWVVILVIALMQSLRCQRFLLRRLGSICRSF